MDPSTDADPLDETLTAREAWQAVGTFSVAAFFVGLVVGLMI